MNWEEQLAQSAFSEEQRQRYRSTIRWFLWFCRKQRPPLTANRKSGNYFYSSMVAERHPATGEREDWKRALGWYLDLVDPKVAPPPGEVHPDADWETLFIQTLRQRYLSYRTEQTYLGWLKRFERFCQGQDLRTVGSAEVQRFLSDLAVKQGVRAATQNQAFNALLFLYRDVLGRKNLDWSATIRARQRKREPVVLSRSEIQRLLEKLEGTVQLMARLMYGTGLRLMELLRLRVNQLDFERGVVVVRGGKGDKDRQTVFPESLKESLKGHLERVRQLHQQDLAEGFGTVWMPESLVST